MSSCRGSSLVARSRPAATSRQSGGSDLTVAECRPPSRCAPLTEISPSYPARRADLRLVLGRSSVFSRRRLSISTPFFVFLISALFSSAILLIVFTWVATASKKACCDRYRRCEEPSSLHMQPSLTISINVGTREGWRAVESQFGVQRLGDRATPKHWQSGGSDLTAAEGRTPSRFAPLTEISPSYPVRPAYPP
jgi:hypothetical protein